MFSLCTLPTQSIMVNVMSQDMTCPNVLLLGVDNVRRKLDLPILGVDTLTEHQIWGTPLTIIESWFQQNILSKNTSVVFYQKGSFTAGFGPTV